MIKEKRLFFKDNFNNNQKFETLVRINNLRKLTLKLCFEFIKV